MGVKIQRPGEPGHPGGNRRLYVRVNYQGHRLTRVFNSFKGAEGYASQVEAMLKLGKVDDVFTDPAPAAALPVPTFKDAAERWWAVDGIAFKGGTLDTYRNILEKHLLPTFGTRSVASITRADVEAWWAGILTGGFSRDRLCNLRAVIKGVFKRAVATGVVQSNPADAVIGRLGRPDREVRQAEWLTEPELTKSLAAAKEREPRYYPLLLTLASTGIRLGESLGLQVGDVDLGRGRLSIRRSVRKGRVGSPKSGKPRTVDAPPSAVAVLRDWIDIARAEAAVRGKEATWMFPGVKGGTQDGRQVRAALRGCLKAVGILRHFRLHDLRHTYASLAIQRGVPLLIVSRQLGHGSVAITDRVYGHLAPEATRQAALAWEAILTEPGRNLGATQTPEPA
ncbi:MAG: site-specific integrase [candidate division NC10 bacterium]|nr:site-specific integrase [candidate division NC10 bacterium]